MAQIGINVELKVSDWPTTSKIGLGSDQGWNLWTHGFGIEPFEGPASVMQPWVNGQGQRKADPVVDALFDKINAEMNPEKQKQLFTEFENRMADEAIAINLGDYVQFQGRRVLYTWIGGTRRDWRGQGFFRALTEQQELWAIEQGFDEIVVKTKNKFYDMRGTLDHLRFEVVKYERNAADNAESKVYLSKKLLPEMISTHRSKKAVVQMPV